MKDYEWIKEYLDTEYIGFIKNQYEEGCPLQYNEINNFVQNVGRYEDVEIVREEDGEVLLDTYGCFVNKIFPTLSISDRSTNEARETINYIARELTIARAEEGECVKPTKQIEAFMKETLGQEIVDKNNALLEEMNESISDAMEMQM